MKKISGLKLGIGTAIAALFAVMPANAFAASVKVSKSKTDSTPMEITTAESSYHNSDSTASYSASDKSLVLNGFTGTVEVSGIDLKIVTGDKMSTLNSFTSDRSVTFNDTNLTVKDFAINGGGTTSVTKTPTLTLGAEADLTIQNGGSIKVKQTASSTKGGIIFNEKLCAVSVSKDTVGQATTYTIAGPSTIKAGNCKNDKSPSSPDTFDAVYLYVALFVASSAIFAYRRHLAKR